MGFRGVQTESGKAREKAVKAVGAVKGETVREEAGEGERQPG